MFSNCNFCYSFFFLLLFAIAKLSFFVFFFFCWCHSTDRRQNNRNQFWVNEDLLSNNDCRRPSYLIALTSTLSKIVRSSDATCTCGFSTNSFESFNSIAAHRTSWPNDSVQFSVCIRAAAVLVKHVAAFEQHTISTYMNISLRVANVFSLLSHPQFVSQKMGQQQQMNNPNFMKSPAVRIEQSQNRFHERERETYVVCLNIHRSLHIYSNNNTEHAVHHSVRSGTGVVCTVSVCECGTRLWSE